MTLTLKTMAVMVVAIRAAAALSLLKTRHQPAWKDDTFTETTALAPHV
jgi:hypothetical protein